MAANCKLSLLDLGRLDVDDGFFRGATAAVQSNPHPGYEMKHLQHRYNATTVYGHDASVLEELTSQARTFD